MLRITYYSICITILLVVSSRSFAQSEDEVTLRSPEVTDFGTWGDFQNCSNGKLVTGFQLKVEPKHSVDDTALNGIRFFCGNPPQPNAEGGHWENVTSRIGHFGNWGHVFNCSTYVKGFQLQSQEYQGPKKDDTAANNLKVTCGDGRVIEGFNDNGHSFKDSTYTETQECPTGRAVCGLQTQVERYQGFGDDTALNNLRVKCCPLKINVATVSTGSPILTPGPDEQTTTGATQANEP